MKWSLPIGRVLGISMRLHVTFLLFLAAVSGWGYLHQQWTGAIWSLAFISSIFVCIAIHELGHSVVAQQFGVEVRSITLLPIGGVAALKRLPENPMHEIAITLAGPLMNAMIALLLMPFTGLPQTGLRVPIPHDVVGLMRALVGVNLGLFLFNFIPAFPMDGGRLVRATMALMFSYRRATAIAVTVGQVIALFFILIGVTALLHQQSMQSVWAIVIGTFIFTGAEGEDRMVKTRSLLGAATVRDLMATKFHTLAPDDTVARALDFVHQAGQDDFPVVQNGTLVGVVIQEDIIDAANKQARTTPVRVIMATEFITLEPGMGATQVYEEILPQEPSGFPVLEDGKLVGWLSSLNVDRYLKVRGQLKPARSPASPAVAAVPTPAPLPGPSVVPPIGIPPTPAEPGPTTGPA